MLNIFKLNKYRNTEHTFEEHLALHEVQKIRKYRFAH